MYRPMPVEGAVQATNMFQQNSRIPLLIAANLEKGGNGIVTEGTLMGSPMEVAATDSADMAAKLGTLCAREGAAVGANWAFAPIIDINTNFRNPITNTRTFGSDAGRVKAMGVAYVEAVQKLGLAACIKHFPGDGQDERDQHLVTSINSMSCEEWDATYGKVYSACIAQGALTCMVGHIMQPAYSKRLNPALSDGDILPASLSSEIINGLLRGKLGFNGLVVTDATTMAGYTTAMSRRLAVPTSIAAGCDMFLFCRNTQEDYGYMLDGGAQRHHHPAAPRRSRHAHTRHQGSAGAAQAQGAAFRGGSPKRRRLRRTPPLGAGMCGPGHHAGQGRAGRAPHHAGAL